jgi:hypothetical protein
VKVKLELHIKQRDGKHLASIGDSYGVTGFSGPKDSAQSAAKKAFNSYLFKTTGKL